MNEIPDDIRETALKLSSWTFGSTDDKDVMEVAAALMAERERCAKIAEDALTIDLTDDRYTEGFIDGMNAAAAAIRRTGTP